MKTQKQLGEERVGLFIVSAAIGLIWILFIGKHWGELTSSSVLPFFVMGSLTAIGVCWLLFKDQCKKWKKENEEVDQYYEQRDNHW